MNETLKTAIRERLEMNFSEAEILADLREAGYPDTIAKTVYDTVVAEMSNHSGYQTSEKSIEVTKNEVISVSSTDSAPIINSNEKLAENLKQWQSAKTEFVPPPAPDPDDVRWGQSGVDASPDFKSGALEVPSPPVGDMAEAKRKTPLYHNEEEFVIMSDEPAVSKGKQFITWFIIILIFSAIAGMIAYGVYTGRLTQVYQQLTSSPSGAPYSTEQELFSGLIDDSKQLTAYGFNFDLDWAIGKKSADTPLLSKEVVGSDLLDGLAEMMRDGFREADLKIYASGLLDLRVKEKPEFDVSLGFNFLAEPILMNMAGSMRLVNGNLYGKIDKFPANLAPYIPDIPNNTWILMFETDNGLPFFEANTIFPLLEATNLSTSSLEEILRSDVLRLATLPLTAGSIPKPNLNSQSAQLGGIPMVDTSTPTIKRVLEDRAMALLKEYPLLTIVNTQSVKEEGEVLYRYEVDFNATNLMIYFNAMFEEISSLVDPDYPVYALDKSELEEEAKQVIAFIEDLNRWSTVLIDVRPDGSMSGYNFYGKVAFDHPELDREISFSMKSKLTKQDDGMKILPPTDLHPKTLEEIVESEWEKVRADVNDASIKQSLSHTQGYAEIAYTKNGNSYATVCEDNQINRIFTAMQENNYTPSYVRGVERDGTSGPGRIVCNDQKDSYAIVAPLASDPDVFWCVDSSGFSGPASTKALSSGRDTTCRE